MRLNIFLALILTSNYFLNGIPPVCLAKRPKNFLGTTEDYRNYISNLIMLVKSNGGDVEVLYSEFLKQNKVPGSEVDIQRWFNYLEYAIITLFNQSSDSTRLVKVRRALLLRVYAKKPEHKQALRRIKNWIEADRYAKQNHLEVSMIKIPVENVKYVIKKDRNSHCFYFKLKETYTEQNPEEDKRRFAVLASTVFPDT